ncbi:MAG: endonuclease MutS2 [Lachnospiraceae bacterium]|nr:endonuclease MutS2 [Lachnospiraceae bacterium]
MNQKVLHVLEYDKIIRLLVKQADSESGRRLCEELRPMSDMGQINEALGETGDALARTLRRGDLSFAGLSDPGESMKRLEVGGALNADELLALLSLLDVTKRAKAYSREARPDAVPREENAVGAGDSLSGMFDALEPLSPLAEEIRRCIPSPDEISEDASPELKNIRRKIRGTGDRIHNALNGMLNNSVTRSYLQDAVITMRNDRYCLPVRAEYKAKVPGMIHDQSSSGSTLFIEPMAVVNLNNDLRELFLQEQAEIDRILSELSGQAAEHIPEISEDFHILVTLDFIFAKAKLARIQDAMLPVFNTERRICIRKGRHPLLDPKKVVPIDIRLGEDFSLLVITGPNTGGKTVTLKTVGLLTLMGQAGLYIPAGDHSELAVFKQVYADIGDEQSIEQSLSTFSSHMTNIASILKRANRGSLVLFDELCAGTDPDEGAALAISILERLRTRDIRAMCTTHYSEIKLYALSTEGVENACCEFDVENLSPTYNLLIGLPGKSNAFSISQKLGLDARLIDDARSRISAETESFEDVISNLEERRRKVEQDQAEIGRFKADLESQKEQLDKQQEDLEETKAQILREANEEAAGILKNAKAVADEAIRNFHKFGTASPDAADMERERNKVREEMTKAQNASAVPKKARRNSPAPEKLHLGDQVRILDMNLTGTVHTLPDAKGNLYVQAGIMRYKVNIRDLALIEEKETLPTATHATGAGSLKQSKSRSISPEINLIGMTVDEALMTLDKYLDDAYLAHLKSVRIVHGKGTGALRNAVQNRLRQLNYIEDFHLGEFGEGDTGVTIATFC